MWLKNSEYRCKSKNIFHIVETCEEHTSVYSLAVFEMLKEPSKIKDSMYWYRSTSITSGLLYSHKKKKVKIFGKVAK